jgi:hypothetical protein
MCELGHTTKNFLQRRQTAADAGAIALEPTRLIRSSPVSHAHWIPTRDRLNGVPPCGGFTSGVRRCAVISRISPTSVNMRVANWFEGRPKQLRADHRDELSRRTDCVAGGRIECP